MFTQYDTWIMIAIFLIGMPTLIYGAYWIKKKNYYWSPFRLSIFKKKEPEPEPAKQVKDFTKNIERMKEIEKNEESYIPQKKLFKAAILGVKDELEGRK